MTRKERMRLVLSPPAEPTRRDTGLRFTDILFGFVISQLFIRLQNWGELASFVRWQLVAATALVLGSWIGFRRSLNRSDYELKFFNLPLMRFVLDQLMVILYFRIAVLTTADPSALVEPEALTRATLETLVFIFLLYLFWDLGGIWMAAVTESGNPKYPQIEDSKKTERTSRKDWAGMGITAGFLGAFAFTLFISHQIDVTQTRAQILFAAATLLLLLYRLAKEARTSWRVQ